MHSYNKNHKFVEYKSKISRNLASSLTAYSKKWNLEWSVFCRICFEAISLYFVRRTTICCIEPWSNNGNKDQSKNYTATAKHILLFCFCIITHNYSNYAADSSKLARVLVCSITRIFSRLIIYSNYADNCEGARATLNIILKLFEDGRLRCFCWSSFSLFDFYQG